MKSQPILTTITSGLALIVLSVVPLPAGGGDASDQQLIGFAGPATDGSFNVILYNNSCDLGHPGRSAHVCTSAEIFANAADLESEIPAGGFWVHPVVVGVAAYPDIEGNDHIAYRDYSGIHGGAFVDGLDILDRADRLSCNGWSSADGDDTGLSFVNGAFGLASCEELKVVACCGAKCDAGCDASRGDPGSGLCCSFRGSGSGPPMCSEFATCDECVALGGQCLDGTCNARKGRCEPFR